MNTTIISAIIVFIIVGILVYQSDKETPDMETNDKIENQKPLLHDPISVFLFAIKQNNERKRLAEKMKEKREKENGKGIGRKRSEDR